MRDRDCEGDLLFFEGVGLGVVSFEDYLVLLLIVAVGVASQGRHWDVLLNDWRTALTCLSGTGILVQLPS